MDIESLRKIIITDEDILWVESLMGDNIKFDKDRCDIIKNMNSIDIQAFPGSGKTTILVAKLAILAKKWPFSNSGICVLSHTNVAREEIQARLGNSEVGKRLLSYPHFIGTFQSFFDKYVALPWIHSQNMEINIINTEIVTHNRWNQLPRGAICALTNNYKNESACEYCDNIGSIKWKKNGTTGPQILEVIKRSQNNGFFTFYEMLLYAKIALLKCGFLPESIQGRFPILFIDEAQDTDLFQWELLIKAFNADGKLSLRQGYGDSNQAIYGNTKCDEAELIFPRKEALLLSESRRFDKKIANLANTVALSKACMKGTNNEFTKKDIENTIFLFSKEKATQVIKEYGKLVLEVFSDEELEKYKDEGCHVIGMIHYKKKDTLDRHFPKGIYDYWNLYDAKQSKSQTPKFFREYMNNGIYKFKQTGENNDKFNCIIQGIRIIINYAKTENYIPLSKNIYHSISSELTNEEKVKFRTLILKLNNYDCIQKKDWDTIISIVEEILIIFNLKTNDKVKVFCEWHYDVKYDSNKENNCGELNVYHYRDNDTERYVDLRFGSIHSVKGRTHLATLVVETYQSAHNIKSIMKYLCTDSCNKNVNITNKKRLKCQYVAMTRARALLCMAIPIENVTKTEQKKLLQLGWNIKIIE